MNNRLEHFFDLICADNFFPRFAIGNKLFNELRYRQLSNKDIEAVLEALEEMEFSDLERGFLISELQRYKKSLTIKNMFDCYYCKKKQVNAENFIFTKNNGEHNPVKLCSGCQKGVLPFCYFHSTYYEKNNVKCQLFPEKCTYSFCPISGCEENHLKTAHKKVYQERSWKNVKKFLSKASGKIITSDIPVGIEIEAVGKNNQVKRLNIFKVARQVGLTTDMSLRGNYEPIEIQTPPASGIKLEKLITDCTDSMKKDGFMTNLSCGLHIHIGLEQKFGNLHKNPLFYKNLFLTYLYFEPAFFSLVHPDRRSNRFCRSIEQRYNIFLTNKKSIDRLFSQKFSKSWYLTDSPREIKQRIREKRDDTKYLWCNFHSIFRKQGLEIRLLEGTLDEKLILNWIKLHQLFIEKVVSMKGESRNWKDQLPNRESVSGLLTWINADIKLQEYMLERKDIHSKPKKQTPVEVIEHELYNLNFSVNPSLYSTDEPVRIPNPSNF